MNIAHSYFINSRAFTAYTPLTTELFFEREKNYLFDLNYLSCLKIQGENAHDFLQGQLSCDLRQVNHHTIQQGALCNLKGRVLALLDVIKTTPSDYSLLMPADLLDPTQTALMKAALLSRVTLSPSSDYAILGFFKQSLEEPLPFFTDFPNERYALVSQDNAYCYYLGHHLYILLLQKYQIEKIQHSFCRSLQWRGSLAWHALCLREGNIEIYPDSRGLFLPHRIGLDRTGYLSFNKGCYKGQEIIARMHYRSTQKYDFFTASIHTKAPLKSGLRLYSSENNIEIGELIDYCPLAKEDAYLAALSLRSDAPLRIFVEGYDAPITLYR